MNSSSASTSAPTATRAEQVNSDDGLPYDAAGDAAPPGSFPHDPNDTLQQANNLDSSSRAVSSSRSASNPAARSPSARTKALSPAAESWTTGSTQRPPLSSAALAALAESLPPARPPKSAARRTPRTSVEASMETAVVSTDQRLTVQQSTDQRTSHAPAESRNPPGSVAPQHGESAAPHMGSPVLDSSATSTATTPTLGGLSHPRPRPQLASASSTTTRISTASSSAGSSPYPSRRSGAFYTDDSDWTGAGGRDGLQSSSALETPATTVDFSASPPSSPSVEDRVKLRPAPLPLEEKSSGSPNAALAGLGLDFLAPPSSSSLGPDLSARTSFDDDDDLDRNMDLISQFAQTFPSPFPGLLSSESPSALFEAITQDRTLVVPDASSASSSRRRSQATELVPRIPTGLVRPPTMTSASVPTSPTLAKPRFGPARSNLTPPQDSVERLASPAPSLSGRVAAFESETDLFSTDAQTDADHDGDDYDEGEDSFSLYPHDVSRRQRERSASSSLEPPSSSRFIQRAPPQIDFESFAAAIQGSGDRAGLWSEDLPNWEGALPRPGDGVVDWTECRLERQALPANTTHLILARCQTPLQIAPLLTSSISSLSQTLVVLDIGSCGLSEIPSAIGTCCFLEELDIHGNPLATGVLPTFLGTLPALNVLLADDCNIASLPDSLAQLTRLHTLTLRNNRLRTLPAWISRLTALDQLLIDGNPFHWQIHNLVRPLLAHAGVSEPASPVEPVRPGRQRSRSILSPPLGPLRTESSPIVTSLSIVGALEPPAVVSPPLASPALFRSAAGTPVPEDPSETPSRARADSFGPQYEEASDSATNNKDKRKWGRLLKKVSTGRLRSASSASKRAPTQRTVSQPVTRDEESDVEAASAKTGMFGTGSSRSRTKSRPRAAKRQSFLALKAFGGVDPPSAAASSAHALESVMSYLRDLDDLSPDLSLPTIPLDASSPALRHSPSLGALSPGGSHARSSSPGSLRRVQSTHRVPSTGSSAFRGSHASSLVDEPGVAVEPTSEAVAKRLDDPTKRAAVIDEIIATEKSYLRGLQELCAIYVASAAVATTLTSATGKRDTVVPASERRAVFGNVEAIRDFHAKILLPDLLSAANSSTDLRLVADKVGEVFSSHVSFMKIYSSYINGFDDALARIQSWAKPTQTRSPLLPTPTSPAIGNSLAAYDAAAGVQSTLSTSQKKRIKSWLKRCRTHPSHTQISLESYLLLPIQRIPRYRMLLGTLASCTPVIASEDDDAKDGSGSALAQAVHNLEEIANMLNESKRENEGRAQLIMWQNRLVSKFKSPLVQPHRTLLRSGALTLVRSVKRTTMQLEPPLPGASAPTDAPVEEVYTLYTESKEMSLTGLLCNDLLVLVKMPAPPFDADPNAPVELYTVLRLTGGRSALQGGHHRAKPPASVDSPDDFLRLKIGDKAVCYFRCAADPYKNRKEAHAWANAVNLQWEVNT
ncbi:hypothetical protein JCM10908_002218 [Rhodotorula pacifica]|uniref:uncharacterized protein n=1 Tax=Rhodotorula pacifica TaxID=1495444 RepID=UPI00316B149A